MRGLDLVIRAQHKDAADILEVIPREKLRRDIPTTFIHGHVHWLNLATSVIEIRSLKKAWEKSSENWKIDCTPGHHRMYKGCESLVDIQSSSWNMLSSRLKCLDDPENLIITIFPFEHPQSLPIRRLSVVLPRYGLSFFVNEDGELESRDFKNMVYDENQCIGTLFGLESQLVLRSSVQVEEELVHRIVIIPDGRFFRRKYGYHVHVKIDTSNPLPGGKSIFASTQDPPPKLVTYHTYEVDSHLGYLTGHASWKSKLYLAHLHALTSVDWRPDPLTGRTGIQEALYLLRSAGCRSIMELDTRHNEPKSQSHIHYKHYPQLSFAIQEIDYLIGRDKFLRTNLSGQFGHPQRPQLKASAVLQTAYLIPFEDSGPIHMPTGVRNPKFSEPDDLACTISLAIYHWIVNTAGSVAESRGDTNLVEPTLLRAPVWANLGLLPPMVSEIDNFLQGTDLNRPSRNKQDRNIPPLSIAAVEALLQEAKEARQRFRLLFLLPTTVYRQRDPQPAFLSILVALAKQIPLKNLPRYADCRPSYGYRPSRDALKKYIINPQHLSTSQVDEELDTMMGQWSTALSSGTAPVISLDSHLCDNEGIQSLFSICYRNLRLKEEFSKRLSDYEAKLHNPSNPAQSSRQLEALDVPPEAQHHTPWQATLDQLFRDRPAPNVPAPSRLRRHEPQGNISISSSDPVTHTLNQLFASLRMNKTDPSFQQQYISRLHSSARYVREDPCVNRRACGAPTIAELRKHYVECRANYMSGLTILREELGPRDDPLCQALDRSGQWPQITPNTLFRCLSSTSPIKLPGDWKDCVVSLVLLLLELQRARRLLRFALDNLKEELYTELENEGCDGWRAKEYPDWLLVQVGCPRRVFSFANNLLLFHLSCKETSLFVDFKQTSQRS